MKMNFGDIKSEKDLAGFEIPPPGMYHAIISHVDDSGEKVDALQVQFTCLAGTVAEGIDKVFSTNLFFPHYDAKDGGRFARKRLARLLWASGAVSESQLMGQEIDVDWQWLAGRQLVIKVAHRSYTDRNGNERTGCEIDGMGMWPLGHADVASVPKHNAMAESYAKSQASPAPVAAAAGPSSDPYEGL